MTTSEDENGIVNLMILTLTRLQDIAAMIFFLLYVHSHFVSLKLTMPAPLHLGGHRSGRSVLSALVATQRADLLCL